MSGMTFKVEDNSDQVLLALNDKVEVALKAIGQTAEKYAKGDCPVDTGRLRNSISNKVVVPAAYVGTNVEYASYVEFNETASHEVGKAHFLRDAAANHADEYKDVIKKVLQK